MGHRKGKGKTSYDLPMVSIGRLSSTSCQSKVTRWSGRGKGGGRRKLRPQRGKVPQLWVERVVWVGSQSNVATLTDQWVALKRGTTWKGSTRGWYRLRNGYLRHLVRRELRAMFLLLIDKIPGTTMQWG